jgi:hypothetical protein
MYQELASKSPNISHQIEKSGEEKKKKKKTTYERDLVLGPVAAEVVDRPAGHAPLEAKHLLPCANRNLLDPLYTDVGCCCLVEDLKDIYRQMMEDCENQTTNDDSHGLIRE